MRMCQCANVPMCDEWANGAVVTLWDCANGTVFTLWDCGNRCLVFLGNLVGLSWQFGNLVSGLLVIQSQLGEILGHDWVVILWLVGHSCLVGWSFG